MNLRTTQVLQIVLIAISFILIAVFWKQIPQYVPVHFNLQGSPGNFVSKSWGIFVMPALSLFTFILVQAIPYIDPKQTAPEHRNILNQFSLVTIVFTTGLFLLLLFGSTGKLSNGFNYIPYLCVLMLLAMGNFMGKLRPNYFVGIRTPWTLENETVWIKTHRFSGRIWVAASLIMLLLWFFVREDVRNICFYIYLGIISIIPVLYSFLIFRKIKRNEYQG